MIQHLKTHYKLVEYYLYNYQQFKEDIKNAKEDMYYSSKNCIPQYINNVGYVSNPVEQAVINYEKKYGKVEKWTKIIEKCLDMVKKENQLKHRLIELRYFKNKKFEDIAEELNIDITTCWRWKEEFVNLVLMLAIEERLVKVFEH